MAHKTGSGSTKNNRDSKSKKLGLKCAGNQHVKKGSILIRQRGTKFKAGIMVGCGKDHTLYALSDGVVHFENSGFVNILSNQKPDL